MGREPTRAALRVGLSPIVLSWERRFAEREAAKPWGALALTRQRAFRLDRTTTAVAIVIDYEPVWPLEPAANATAGQAQEVMHSSVVACVPALANAPTIFEFFTLAA